MPRSAPGPTTRSPSMRTSPAVGLSRPPMIDSSVDLPQPDAPSRQTSSPSSTCRSTWSSAATDALAGRRTTLDTPSTDELRRRRGRRGAGGERSCGHRTALMAGPGSDAAAHPAEEQVADQADHAEDDQQGEHGVDRPEALGPDDLERQALLGGEQLGHHQHQPGGGQVDAGDVDDAGQRVRQDHPAQHGEAARAQRVGGVEQLTGHVPGHVGHHQDVVEDGAHHDEPDLRALVDAQPQQEQRA